MGLEQCPHNNQESSARPQPLLYMEDGGWSHFLNLTFLLYVYKGLQTN